MIQSHLRPKNPIAELRLKAPSLLLSKIIYPKEIISFNHHYLIPADKLLNLKLISCKTNYSFFWGQNQSYNLELDQNRLITNIFPKIITANPLFPFTKNKILIKEKSRDLFLHWSDGDLNVYERPLAYFEYELLSNVEQNKERIQYLIQNVLTKIEDREDNANALYKDKNDGRFWQSFVRKENDISLFNVTLNQWNYRFIEMRELKKLKEKGTALEYVELANYYDTLQEGSEKIPCKQEGCQNFKARFSNLCKDHHFEAIMGVNWASVKSKVNGDQ